MRRRDILALLSLAGPSGCRARPQPGVKIDPALATLTPETAIALVGVRMDSLRATPFYKRQAAAGNLLEFDEFARDTGIDPNKDLWELLYVFEESEPVVMARGKFSPGFGGLEPRVLPNAPRTRYKGYTLIGDERTSTVFVNSSTAISGAARAVRGILDRRSGSRGIPAALEEQIRKTPASAQIWAAWSAPLASLPLSLEGNWANLAKIARMIHGGALAADLRKGAELAAIGACGSRVEAKLLHDGLRGITALARMSAPRERPELVQFYDALRFSQPGQDVRVEAALPPDVVEKLIPMLR